MEENENYIDGRVFAGGQEFAQYSQRFQKVAPHYVLDFSWPSVSLVDYYIQHLRGKEHLSKGEEHLFLGASSYISGLAMRCLESSFPKSTVRVEYEHKSIDLLIYTPGRTKKNQNIRLAVSESLHSILAKPNEFLPYFANTKAHTIPESNLTQLFSYGLFSGLSPYGEGGLAEAKADSFGKQLSQLNNILADSSSHYYKNCFRAEKYGKNPDLYSNGLIYPPVGYGEKFVYANAVAGTIEHLAKLSCKQEDTYQLALNLAKSPDETFSSIGFVLAIASLPKSAGIPIELAALADSFIERSPSLVPALMLARRSLYNQADWMDLLDLNETDAAIRLIELEKRLGLIPTFKVKTKRAKDKQFHLLLKFIRLSQTKRGREEVDNLIKQGVATSDIIIQGIAFDLYHNDTERAEKELANFPSEYLEEDPDLFALYSELSATFYERTGEDDKAKKLILQSLERNIKDELVLEKNLLFLSNYLSRENNWPEVLKLSERILTINPGSVSARINIYFALRMLKQEEPAIQALQDLYSLSPMDRRVFGLVQSAFASLGA